MPRIGTNPNLSSDQLESKMLPNIEERGERGGYVDLMGDGQHKIYMHRAQLEIYNWQSNVTRICASRGFGKTSLLALWLGKCFLGLRRQMGGFVGASAKQIFTRTMPNVLKVLNTLGFEEGVFYFRGQAPAKLRWDMPLAKPRVWENIIHFCTGYCEIMLSMAVRGSGNGLNLASLKGDETKYLPWPRVKEELIPTLRGDFMPPSARKTEVKRWGYGTDPKTNPFWLSQFWISDRGLTQRERLWEKEKEFETTEVNEQIAEMLAELKYLEQVNPKMAYELAQNETFLKRLHLLRSQSETFWNFSSLENLSLLGGEAFVRRMQRELPELEFNLQILGLEPKTSRDGFYSNFDQNIHTYMPADITDTIYNRFMVKQQGKALDVQKWPTAYEHETLQLDAVQQAGETSDLDLDLELTAPLRMGFDTNANMNIAVVAQTRQFEGRETALVLRTFYTMNEKKLIALCTELGRYYRPFIRMGCGEVIVYFTSTIKQGGATAYAVEGAIDNRFDKVIERELRRQGFKVTMVDMGGGFSHEAKHRVLNEMFAGLTAPFVKISREPGYNDHLICAIENAGVLPNFKKDKRMEKYGQSGEGHRSDYDGVAGDPKERTDVTDAMDDVLLGIKYFGAGSKKIGGRLRGRFTHLAGIPR